MLLLWVLAQACAHAAAPVNTGAPMKPDSNPAATTPSPTPSLSSNNNTAAQPPRKTIDDIIQAAQKKGSPMSDFSLSTLPPPGPNAAASAVVSKPATPLPPPLPSPRLSMPLPPAATLPSQGPVLVGLYLNYHTATAEFNIDGHARYLSVGGRLPGGWVIEKITTQAVHLSKCELRKECRLKVMYYEAS
jgi:hypothetical protein